MNIYNSASSKRKLAKEVKKSLTASRMAFLKTCVKNIQCQISSYLGKAN
jgi:hypothetical protein